MKVSQAFSNFMRYQELNSGEKNNQELQVVSQQIQTTLRRQTLRESNI